MDVLTSAYIHSKDNRDSSVDEYTSNEANSVLLKMKCTKYLLLSVFGVVLATVQISSTAPGEGEHARPVEDAYENYQQINENYQLYENVQKPNPSQILNKQSFGGGAADFMGPNTDMIIGGTGMAVGLIALVVSALQGTEQRSICKTGKEIGDTALTLSSTTQITSTTWATAQPQVVAQLNLIENALNGISTPTCTS